MKRICLIIIFLGIYIATVTAGDITNTNLNTARNSNYLNSLEKEVIYELNLFRSNPARYAQLYIAPLAKYYNYTILNYPGDRAIRTKEGVRALYECIRELKRETPKPTIYPNKDLSLSARDHQRDQQRTGRRGHTGSDRSILRQRIERYGEWEQCIGENIAYGNTSARQIVIFLLIDDGVRNRGHRKSLLNPKFKLAGVACGLHPVYKTMCVIDLAGGMNEESINAKY